MNNALRRALSPALTLPPNGETRSPIVTRVSS